MKIRHLIFTPNPGFVCFKCGSSDKALQKPCKCARSPEDKPRNGGLREISPEGGGSNSTYRYLFLAVGCATVLEAYRMTNDLIKMIFARRSVRKYTTEPVSEKEVTTLLEAAMAAPSSANRKPWHFIVVTHRQILDNLARVHPYGKMLFEAPLCIAVCGDKTISARSWVQDCSAAIENLLLAAAALGLGAVWLGVHPLEERVSAVKKELRIPDNIVPLNLISIGHPAEEKEPRTQYDELRVHHEHW